MIEPNKGRAPSKINISIGIVLVCILPFLSNIIVVLCDELTSVFIYTPSENAAVRTAIEKTNVPFIVMVFTLGTLAVVIFMLPCLRWMFSRAGELRKNVRRRITYMPLVLSLLGLVGWGLYAPAYFIGAAMHGMPLISHTTLMFVLDRTLTGFMSFVLCYYPLELIVRRTLVPYFFPDGDFSEFRNSWRPSIRTRLYIMYFSIGVFPMYLMYCMMLHMRAKSVLAGSLTPLHIALPVLLALGLFITMLISRLLHDPLVEMRRAVTRVNAGDLDVRVSVESNDEVGNLGEALNEMVSGLREKEFIKDTFGKMVDPSVRDHLLSGNIGLGGDTRDATVLFCDIRGFTGMSEKMKPDAIVEMLNRFFDELSACIMAEKGIVNKYIGDALMAIFGAPIPLDNHADAAVAAAKRIGPALVKLNAEFEARGLPPLKIGIGIHSGPVLVGNIGSRVRMEYTAIGDTVNTTARVEKLCKKHATGLLITESTANRLSPCFAPQFLATETLRGREKPISIYTV